MPKKTTSTKARRKAKRIGKLHKQGKLVRGVHVPKSALPANPDEQALPESLSVKYFYTDTEFVCRGCGGSFVWTAAQQKRYFEDQKGNLYNKPVWCTPCHRKRMDGEIPVTAKPGVDEAGIPSSAVPGDHGDRPGPEEPRQS